MRDPALLNRGSRVEGQGLLSRARMRVKGNGEDQLTGKRFSFVLVT